MHSMMPSQMYLAVFQKIREEIIDSKNVLHYRISDKAR